MIRELTFSIKKISTSQLLWNNNLPNNNRKMPVSNKISGRKSADSRKPSARRVQSVGDIQPEKSSQ